MEILNKKQKIILIGVGVIMLLVIGFYITHKMGTYKEVNLNEFVQGEEIIEEEREEKLEENIIVYITGEVLNDGIVEIEEGARISDIIERAGGLTKEADLSKVNLAYKVQDGEKVYIPSKKEKNKEEKEVISLENGEEVIPSGNNTSVNSKVNINKASQAELETLQGVGPSTAMKIIDYRNNSGKFKTIEDIKNVSGIGEAKFNNIKNSICI